MRDAYGRKAPVYLREIFRGRRRLMKLVRQLETLRGQLASIANDPSCRYIDIRRALRGLEAARALVIRGAPLAICDCGVENTNCEKCGGQRWLPIDNLPLPKGLS